MPLPQRLSNTGRAARRSVLRRRRPLAALLTAVAVYVGISALAPNPPATVPVVVAQHDLAAGARLGDADLATVRFAPGTAPEGAITRSDDVADRVLAAPLRQGEPVTDVRLVGPSLTAGLDGRVATPVRLPDAAMVALLEVGDLIDLVAVDPQDGGTQEVARAVPVLAIPRPDATSAGDSNLPGRLVVLGVTSAEVAHVSETAVRLFVTYTWSSR